MTSRLPGPRSLDLAEIYHVLFRRKVIVLACTAAGLAAAVALQMFRPPPYESEAKLFIRYVAEARGPATSVAVAKSPDQRGETILDSEMEIITSRDLARQVAATLGPSIVLGPQAREVDLESAAAAITAQLRVESPPRSSVIRLTYRHADPAVARRVLEELIARYLQTHLAVHRSVGLVGDFLGQETDQLRTRLARTEDQLRLTRQQAGVISLDETKAAYATQLAALRQQIFATQAELAERRATVAELRRRAAPTANPDSAAPAEASAADTEAYRAALYRVALLQRQEQELLTVFRDDTPRLREHRTQLTAALAERQRLETEHPGLRASAVAAAASPLLDPEVEAVRIAALEAKLRTLDTQLAEVRTDAAAIDNVESSLVELRRRQQLEETNYRHYSESLEQSRLDEALGAGRVSNISQIQSPSPGARDPAATLKRGLLLGVGGLGLGLLWAFAAELYFDRSVKRPSDVERLLQPSFLLAVPQLNDGRRPSLAAPPSSPGALELAPFHDTLRDRLVAYFAAHGLVHKPKLIGVTGLGSGSGISTTAVGLARSLSTMEDCNVLLADLAPDHESARHFAGGAPVCDLDQVLSSREPALLADNLYVVAESDRLPRNLPQRFSRLVPRLKASEFDYIVFDLPAVSPTSITARLAGQMDLTVLVVEAESTGQEVLQRAAHLLADANAPVAVVLNKTRSYVPTWLHQDFQPAT